MRSTLITLCLVFLHQFSIGQCDTNRYVNPIFTSVYKHSNVKYGEAPVWSIPYYNTDLFMDIYEPIGDLLTKRPLMLWVHPGGFLLGDKEADDMVALCDSFARRGYVTASIGYRLGFNPLSSNSAERAVYRGTQDVRAAIRYLMEYSDVFDIDTNHIFLGGSSAGGVATLHVAYIDQDEVPTSTEGGVFGNDLGCLDCTGNTYSHEISLAGIVNMWGAIGDSTWIDADETIPALLIHGVEDGVVPFGVGHAFGVSTTPVSHGSRSVHNRLDSLGIDHVFLPFVGQDHEPHGTSNGYFSAPPTPYWDTIFNAVNDHYFAQLKPNEASVFGDEIVCDNDMVWYSVDINSNESACWIVENGTIIENLRDSVLVEWIQGTGSVSARIKSTLDAVSDESTVSVEIKELPNSIFTYVVDGAMVSFDMSSPEISNVDWSFGDYMSGNGQVVEHFFSEEGTYEVGVIVTGTNACVNQSSQLISVNEGEIRFGIYPNPTENELHLVNVPKGAKVIINDALGKKLMKTKVSETQVLIEVKDYRAGVYFVTVVYAGDRQTKRFVKK